MHLDDGLPHLPSARVAGACRYACLLHQSGGLNQLCDGACSKYSTRLCHSAPPLGPSPYQATQTSLRLTKNNLEPWPSCLHLQSTEMTATPRAGLAAMRFLLVCFAARHGGTDSCNSLPNPSPTLIPHTLPPHTHFQAHRLPVLPV